jgi:acetyl/propionyl-CoA carboxylase alpha subunit
MLGKLIVHAEDRKSAIHRLARALAEYEVAGVETTLPLLRALTADSEFVRAQFDVQWLDRRLADGLLTREAPGKDAVWLAALTVAEADAPRAGVNGAPVSAWREAARREALS